MLIAMENKNKFFPTFQCCLLSGLIGLLKTCVLKTWCSHDTPQQIVEYAFVMKSKIQSGNNSQKLDILDYVILLIFCSGGTNFTTEV
jgi:hypothetical protein